MAKSSHTSKKDGLSIPPPRADRPPLRKNVYESVQKGNSALLPLFPHLYPGAMVPASAGFRGGPDKRYGHFFHHNTVDEVTMTFGANGALLKPGQMFVGARLHGVDSFLKNENDPESFAIFCITQRQSESGPQKEAFSIACAECREEVFRIDLDVTPKPEASEGELPFATIEFSEDAVNTFNADKATRTCAKCGHINEPFPGEIWGWSQYTEKSGIVTEGRDTLESIAAEMKPSAA